VLVAAAALALVSHASAQALAPGNLVTLDALADPLTIGAFGATFEIDRGLAPETPARTIGSSLEFLFLQSVAVEPAGTVLLTDSEADPAGLGADPNSGLGHGAVFRVDPDSGDVSVLSDGQDYLPGLPPSTASIFVDPSGLAVDAIGSIFVADPDADPSGYGPDPNGFAGHGAIFFVIPGTGEVDLIADGSNYPAGLPGGAPSVFVDPIAIAPARDGTLLVLDIGADPLAAGAFGSIFRVEPFDGEVTLVSSDLQFAGPFDLAEELSGDIVVADWSADPFSRGDRGAIFRIDLTAVDPTANAAVLAADAATRNLGGITATDSGHIFAADSLADPLALGRTGTVWSVDPVTGQLTVVSSTTGYLSLSDVEAVRSAALAPVITSLDPATASQGDSIAVTVHGRDFAPGAIIRLGAGIAVTNVTFVSAAELLADIVVAVPAAPGDRDVVVGNPDLNGGLLVDGFEVLFKPRPRPDRIAPPSAAQSDSLTVVIDGDYFDLGATVEFGAGIAVADVRFVSGQSLEVDLIIDTLAPIGARDVVVTNPDRKAGTLASGFEVTLPRPPLVTGVTPSAVSAGAIAVTVNGTDFRAGAAVNLGSDVAVSRVEVVSSTALDVWAGVPFDAAPGPRDVTVTNADLTSHTLAGGLTIASAPVVRLASLAIDDRLGNGDGAIDPGETVDLPVTVVNQGNATATGLELRLVQPVPVVGVSVDVSFTTLPDAVPDAVVGRSAPPHLALAIDGAVVCGTRIELELHLHAASGSDVVVPLSMRIGHPLTARVKPRLDGRAGDRLGAAVAAAGDLDGDGADDFLIGAPYDDPDGLGDAGTTLVVSGAGGTLLYRLTGGAPGDRLGASIAGGADVDGDGVLDFAIGVPGAAGGGDALVVSGASGAILLIAGGVSGGDELGAAVALADVDGDGRADLVVGSPGATSGAGRIDLFSGRSGQPVWSLGGRSGDALGSALAAGDLDGDGLAEIVAGSPGAGSSAGRIEAHSLVSGLYLERDGVAGERLGAAVALAGDVDGDGFGDIVIGAPGHDPGGLPRAGRALVLSGAGGGLLRQATGAETGEALGTSVAGGRDMDDDGLADVAWSSPGAGGGDPNAPGRVEVVSGMTGQLILGHDGGPGENAGRGGLALLDRLGDTSLDLLIGSPTAAPAAQIDAGTAYVLERGIECTGPLVCLDDRLEENDTFAAASAIIDGVTSGLARCAGDEDWFAFVVPAGEQRSLTIEFDGGRGDLDLFAYDSLGSLVDLSAGTGDQEMVVVSATATETFRVRIASADGRSNDYRVILRNTAACDPIAPLDDLMAVRGSGPGEVTLSWTASTDPCHEAISSSVGYRLFTATEIHPVGAPSFPDDPSFADVTADDRDGSTSDPGWTGPVDGAGLTVVVVVDVGTSGARGPVSSWAP